MKKHLKSPIYYQGQIDALQETMDMYLLTLEDMPEGSKSFQVVSLQIKFLYIKIKELKLKKEVSIINNN